VPRKASSVSEIAQIVRVHDLLHQIGVAPSPLLEVTTAGGNTFVGQLLRAAVGNRQGAKGWSSYGAIMLATERGKVEIDYLDVATVEVARPPEPEAPSLLDGSTKRRPKKKSQRS
jgi:hypothetical protein